MIEGVSECTQVFMDLTNNFITYSDTVLHIFRNSGKDYNDFGRYQDCESIHHFNFYMATVLKRWPIPMVIGLCLPRECTIEDLNEFKPFLVSAVNGAVPNLFEEVKGFDPNATITEEDMLFVNSKHENDKVLMFDGGAMITSILIAGFALTVLTSTFVVWYQRKEEYQRQQSRQQKNHDRRRSQGFENDNLVDTDISTASPVV